MVRKFCVTNTGILESQAGFADFFLLLVNVGVCPMSASNRTTLIAVSEAQPAVSEAHLAAFVLLGIIGCLVTSALVLLFLLFSCVGCKQRAARASEQTTQTTPSIPLAERATDFLTEEGASEGASEQRTLSIPTAELATEEGASEGASESASEQRNQLIPLAELATEVEGASSGQRARTIPLAELATYAPHREPAV